MSRTIVVSTLQCVFADRLSTMNDLSRVPQGVDHEPPPVTLAPGARSRTKRYIETAAPATASKRAKTEMLQNQTPNQKAAVNEQMVKQAAAINVSPLPANQQKPAEVSAPAKRQREAEPQDAAPPPVSPPVIQIRSKHLYDRS